MSDHSPGPWTLKRSPGGRKVHISGDHWFKFARVWVSVGGVTSDEGLANANLIVAAPDLLAALKDAMRSSRKDFEAGRDGDRKHQKAYAEQFAAIAKAEGRS
jgi:hypothetical protein